MEKDIAIGSVGGLKISLGGGKAVVSIGVEKSILDGASVTKVEASEMVDASVLVDLLFKAIEANSPPGAVLIEESVKEIVKKAVAAIQ